MSQSAYCNQEVLIGDSWHHYRDVGLIKDCEIMGYIGSSRYADRWAPIQREPTGLPDDATELTNICLVSHEPHLITSLTPHSVIQMYRAWDNEIKRHGGSGADLVWTNTFGYLFNSCWHSWYRFPESWKLQRKCGLRDYRWIFSLEG